jgi:transcriptional regulator with XRE-family HTH domain
MTQDTVAKIVSKQLEVCKNNGKTQSLIALEVGFENPNMITHIKQGKSKLPPSRAFALADALGVDRNYLMRLALNEKWDGAGDLFFDNIERFREMKLIEDVCWKMIEAEGIDYDSLSESEQKEICFKINHLVSTIHLN